MGELSIKEKAERYDKVVERAKKMFSDKEIDYLFPELKELDGEKIRKALIDGFTVMKESKNCGNTFSNHNILVADILNWLEKQGKQKSYGQREECEDCQFNYAGECKGYCQMKRDEQKPTDKVEPKFKIEKGKWYVCVKDLLDNYANQAFRKGDIYLSTQDGSLIPSNSNVPYDVVCPDTYFRDWTIQDAKDGDVLAFYSEYRGNKMVQIGIIEKYVGKHGGCSNTFKIYVGVNWENNLQIGEYMGCSDIRLATKEQRDTLERAITNASYEWGADKKELKKIEQKLADKYEPMSLDEAIEHCKEKSCGNNACALEHKQLGKWLTELKKLKEKNLA